MPDLRNPGANGLAFMWKWHDIVDQSDKWVLPADYFPCEGTLAAQEMNANQYPFSFSPAYERYCDEMAELVLSGQTVLVMDEFDNNRRNPWNKEN